MWTIRIAASTTTPDGKKHRIDRRFNSNGNVKKELLEWLVSKHPEYLGEAITVITPLHHTVYAFEHDSRGYYLECQS